MSSADATGLWFEEKDMGWTASYCHSSSLAPELGQFLHHPTSVIAGIPSCHTSQYCFLCNLMWTWHISKVETTPHSLFLGPRWPHDKGNDGCLDLSSGTEHQISGPSTGPAYEAGRGWGLKDILPWSLMFPLAFTALRKGLFWGDLQVARLWKRNGDSVEWLVPVSELWCHTSGMTFWWTASFLHFRDSRLTAPQRHGCRH